MRPTQFAHAYLTLPLLFLLAPSAFAQVSATATMTASANPSGDYHYTIDLTNNGTENIETFWFGWLPGLDFLTSYPTATQTPDNWTTYVESGYYGGYSLEFYDSGTSSPLTPGQSTSAFQFDSPDSPDVLSQNDPIYGYYPATFSYLYDGTAEESDSGIINSIPITVATTPEPASLVIVGLGLSTFASMRRSRRSVR
jgi:hypothetical protein